MATSTVPPERIHQLAAVALFAQVDSATLERLAGESRIRRYPRGQVLCSEGDPGDSLLVLEEGRVKISRFSAGGQEIVLSVAEAPTAFGELALIDGAPRSATVTAQTAVVVRILGRDVVLALLEREPSVAMALLRALTAMVRATNERLADVLSLDVPGRVAKWLLARAEAHGERRREGIAVPLGLSQSDLAAELGTTRVSVNKALKGFETRGVIALDLDQDVVLLRRPEELLAYTS
jgi:CRP/FNR family transcriptional regulator